MLCSDIRMIEHGSNIKVYGQPIIKLNGNDAIFGYKNDRAWQLTILERLATDLKCKTGRIIWQVQNLHIYERHFKLIK